MESFPVYQATRQHPRSPDLVAQASTWEDLPSAERMQIGARLSELAEYISTTGLAVEHRKHADDSLRQFLAQACRETSVTADFVKGYKEIPADLDYSACDTLLFRVNQALESTSGGMRPKLFFEHRVVDTVARRYGIV